MNISAPFIKRPRGTSLIAIGVFILGFCAYFFLPIAPLPSVDFPTISIGADVPGIDSQTASSALAAPLERRLGQIPGVIEMTSTSKSGSSEMTVQFDLDRNIDGAARDVEAAIRASAHDLPPEIKSPPDYRKVNPAGSPIMVLAMTSDTMPLSDVYTFADDIICQRISQIAGVSQIMISGGAKTAVRVQVDPAQLASIGLGMNDLQLFLTGANHFAPKGFIETSDRSYGLRVNDQLLDAGDYQDLVIAQRNGVPIPLSFVAKVMNATENRYQGGWFDGKRAVIMPVFKQSDANVIEIVDEINRILPLLRSWLPPGVHLDVVSDRTQTIRASVNDVQTTLIITSALVILVMFLFLRRLVPTFIAGITVPLCIAATFGMMWIFGYSLNNLSLMALTVSVGFLVDDSIVVIENIVRLIEAGKSPMEASILGAKQIGFTVVSMSLSLVAIFLPVLMMGGVMGRLFHEFAMTLSCSILVSLVVSLTLTPSLCARFLEREHHKVETGLAHWFELGFHAMQSYYRRKLDWVFKHVRLVQFLTLGTVFLTVYLYTIVPKGFFPQQDTGLLFGTTEGAQDISFLAMQEKQKQIAKIIKEDPAVAHIASVIGSNGGTGSNNGRLYIALKPKSERGLDVDGVINRLRPKLAAVKGARTFLAPAQDLRMGGRQSRAQYQYALRSDTIAPLITWAPKLIEKLQKYPQLVDVNADSQFQGRQVKVVVDRNLSGSLGIEPIQVDQALYNAFGQHQVSTMYQPRSQFHVILEANPEMAKDPAYLSKIYVKSNSGKMIPLSAIAHFDQITQPLSLNHQGQFPVVTFSFNLQPGVSLGEAEEIVNKAMAELKMPPSIKGGFAGNALLFQDSLSSQPLLILAAILAVYIVLGMLYESLIHPLTILSTIPTAGIGALLALILMKMELSIVAMIGIILLVGIVKKNAIMMVDYAIEAQRERFLSPRDAIYEACLVRFRPIMMTSAAAVFGSLPLAIGMGVGSELRQPLGVAIVGGLVVSQALTLFTTPVVYLFMERVRVWSNGLRGKIVLFKNPLIFGTRLRESS
jgi:hydrophobe/amphiphile efflux-1 (HAE1) family protein